MTISYKSFLKISLMTPLFLFPIFSYFVFNHKMVYMNPEYPMWLHIKDVIHSKNHNVYDLIIVGDSRAKAGFIPNLCGAKKCFNFSVGGGTPIEGYYILKKFLSNNPAPKNLVISFAPSHLDSQDCYWERTVKFDFLDKNEYQEIENTAIRVKDFKTLGSEKSYSDYQIPTKFSTDFLNGVIQRRWSKNIEVYNE